jgi:hypothetical protein
MQPTIEHYHKCKTKMTKALKLLHNEDCIFQAYKYAKSNLENIYGEVIKGESLQKVLNFLENPQGNYDYMINNFTAKEYDVIMFIMNKIDNLL